jgi:hypothetical protein
MSDQPSTSAAKQNLTGVEGPYVVEHYGFVAPSGAAPGDLPRPLTAAPPVAAAPRRSAGRVRRPARDRRRRLLAAGALGLVLTGGIGGVAAAAADTGPGGRGDGGRGGALVQPTDGSPRVDAKGPAGPR